jgi:hypothetical protein
MNLGRSRHGRYLSIVPVVQQAIEAIHTTTSLPWAPTIIASTIAFRSAFIPVSIFQMRQTARLVQLRPHFDAAFARADVKSNGRKLKKWALFLNDGRLICRAAHVNPLYAIISPLLQLPCFFAFSVAIRAISAPDLPTSSFLHLSDLSTPDASKLLPALCVAGGAANVEASLGAARPLAGLKEVLQVGILCAFPFVLGLPKLVLVYWLTSVAFTAAQTAIFRTSKVRGWIFKNAVQPPQPPVAPAESFVVRHADGAVRFRLSDADKKKFESVKLELAALSEKLTVFEKIEDLEERRVAVQAFIDQEREAKRLALPLEARVQRREVEGRVEGGVVVVFKGAVS